MQIPAVYHIGAQSEQKQAAKILCPIDMQCEVMTRHAATQPSNQASGIHTARQARLLVCAKLASCQDRVLANKI